MKVVSNTAAGILSLNWAMFHIQAVFAGMSCESMLVFRRTICTWTTAWMMWRLRWHLYSAAWGRPSPWEAPAHQAASPHSGPHPKEMALPEASHRGGRLWGESHRGGEWPGIHHHGGQWTKTLSLQMWQRQNQMLLSVTQVSLSAYQNTLLKQSNETLNNK